VTDARALATALRITAHEVGISGLFTQGLAALAPVTAGRPQGLTSENLQSRLRGTLVMAAANQLGAMALTTGNKSELACGYCTIYGDMNGGLAPIGDVYKTTVWDLSRRINARAGVERIPVASIDKAPSAELRENQTDQDSLPPYPQLDRILEGFVEEHADRAALVARGEDPAVVDRVLRLVEVSEFKRRQAAPALRVSRKAFGMGRRIPLARRF
jgi:NAD+ synthase (glutamine-hydrolysing)